MEHVERTLTLPTDAEEAWQLLTDPEELGAWLGDDVVLDPTPGAAGRVVERDGSERSLVVERVDEQRHLAWRWWSDGDDPLGGSRVAITLTPTDGGTLVRVVEQRLAAPQARSATATATAMAWAVTAAEAWSHRLLHLESLLLLAAVRG